MLYYDKNKLLFIKFARIITIFMTQISTLLKELGLTSNQAYIYMHLAKKGKAKAGEIIRATGFHRNIVYGTLEELAEKRLIGSSKENGVQVYRPYDAQRIVAEQEERVRKAKELVEELAKFRMDSTPQQIIIYEGKKDFITQARRAYESIGRNKIARTLGTSPIWHELVGHDIGEELTEIQIAKKIHWKMLTKKITNEDKKYVALAKDLLEMKESHLVSDDTNGIEILEDRISIRSFVEPYFIVEIINRQLAENYQKYFDFLWKTSPK